MNPTNAPQNPTDNSFRSLMGLAEIITVALLALL